MTTDCIDLTVLTHRVGRIADEIWFETAKAHGIPEVTPRQGAALIAIRRANSYYRRPSQNQIMAVTRMDRTTASGVLSRLEGRGLVVIERDPNDLRAHCITLTDAGRALAVTCERVSAETDARLRARVQGLDDVRILPAAAEPPPRVPVPA